jgi:hypothetical protein
MPHTDADPNEDEAEECMLDQGTDSSSGEDDDDDADDVPTPHPNDWDEAWQVVMPIRAQAEPLSHALKVGDVVGHWFVGEGWDRGVVKHVARFGVEGTPAYSTSGVWVKWRNDGNLWTHHFADADHGTVWKQFEKHSKSKVHPAKKQRKKKK